VRQPANSTNQKTIGINKLGTLLSSQTTETFDYLRDQRFHASRPVFLRRCVYILFHLSFPCQILRFGVMPAYEYSTGQSHGK
jgi:hypothetical protein